MFRDAVLQAAADAVQRLGESVTLPDATVVLGVFRYPSEALEVRRGGSQRSAVTAPARDPAVSLLEADAVTLARGSTLIIRGQAFDVTDRYPTGNGLVLLTLVEQQVSDPVAEMPWR